ncbi:lipopolysaccharide biosynthesis protein [Haloferax sp. YSSS75]|uniref:lipopolysaccharide biosynthesis protein n=1 Tax=Haloferax sp. YSSS75 TaxID=3388564 RepID=UPI00398CC86A
MSGPEASDVRFGLEVSSGFLIRLVMSGVGFIGTIIFARLLDPSLFGGYYLLLSIVLITVQPIQGFATAAKKRFSETDGSRQEILAAQLVAISLLGAVGAIVAFTFQSSLVDYSGVEEAALLFSMLLVTVSFVESVMTVIEGTGRVSVSNLVDLLGSLLTFPFQLGLVLLGFGASGMAFGLAISSTITGIVGIVVLGVTPRVPSKATIDSIWEFGRFSAISRLASKVLARTDMVLLGLFFTPAIAGYYEVAWKLSVPATLIGVVVGNGLMARVSNLQSKGNVERIRIDLKNALSVTGLFAIPMFFGALALKGELAVTVYGSGYRGAAEFLAWIVLYQLLRKQADQLLNTVHGLDRPDATLFVDVSTLVLNIALGVGLLSVFGPVGVVYASVIAETLRLVGGVVVVRRLVSNLVLFPRAIGEQIVAGVLMFVAVEGINRMVPVRSWVDLTLLLLVGGVTYGTVLVLLSDSHRTIASSVYEQFRDAVVDYRG